MSTLETIKTLNATARTTIAAVVVAGLTLLGYRGYRLYQGPQLALAETQEELQQTKSALGRAVADLSVRQQEVEQLTREVSEQAAKIDRLETSNRLLKVNHRLAELQVLEQSRRPNEGPLVSKVSFVETNDEGQPIGDRHQFEIEGDLVYVDYLVAKFDDQYVESSDLERGTAICLFQRIFGENQEPSEGFAIDQVGTRPTAYARGGAISSFEQQIWKDFWTIANDPEKAKAMGIRAAHGNAASIRVQAGKRYRIRLRATGEFTIQPAEE